MTKRLIPLVVIALGLLGGTRAEAQNNNCQSYLTYGNVLTAPQWQYCLSLKQDTYPFTGIPLSNALPSGQVFVGNAGSIAVPTTLTGDVQSITSLGAVTLKNSNSTRLHLGIQIGTNVEAWAAPLDSLAAATNEAYSTLVQTVVGTYEWVTGTVTNPAIGTLVSPAAGTLRANTIPWPTIHVQGYTGAGTPGGDDFEYVATDITSADNSCTIIVDASGHRYYRQFAGALPITDCGASTTATDNTVAFQAAVNSGAAGVYIPTGTFIVQGVVTANVSSQTIIGPGTLKFPSSVTTGTCASFTGTPTMLCVTATNVTIQGINFSSPGSIAYTGTVSRGSSYIMVSTGGSYARIVNNQFGALPKPSGQASVTVLIGGQASSSDPAHVSLRGNWHFNTSGEVFTQSPYTTVEGDYFYNANDCMLAFNGVGNGQGDVAIGNVFDTQNGGVSYSGICVEAGAYEFTIVGNVFTSVPNGVVLSSALANVYGGVVANNIFDAGSDTTHCAIYEAAVANEINMLRIYGNFMKGNGCGIVISGTQQEVHDNTIFANDGLSCIQIAGTVTASNFYHNHCYAADTLQGVRGFWIIASSVLTNVNFDDNSFEDAGATGVNVAFYFDTSATFAGEISGSKFLHGGVNWGYFEVGSAAPWGTLVAQDISPQLLSTVGCSRYPGTAAPVAGAWKVCDQIYNTTPSEAGSSGNKYITSGFINVSNGTPGTWLQQRTLTGN